MTQASGDALLLLVLGVALALPACPLPPVPVPSPPPTSSPSASPLACATFPKDCPYGWQTDGHDASGCSIFSCIPAPSPSPSASPTPEPTPRPKPTPAPAPECLSAMPAALVAPGRLYRNGKCPQGYEQIEGVPACAARSACTHPDGTAQCYDVPGYDVDDPELQYGCYAWGPHAASQIMQGYLALDAYGFLGPGPHYHANPGLPPAAPRDAFSRGPDGALKRNVCPPCLAQGPPPSPQPSPSPTPGPVGSPTPVPSGAPFNCNGSWTAPSCDMTVSRISMSVYYVQRDRAVVPNCKADDACPARVGDKVFFNSTPRYEDARCTRGAAIPDNCVGLPAFAYRAEWTGATRDEGANSLGYLASEKLEEGGDFDVRVCVGSVCSAVVTVRVR